MVPAGPACAEADPLRVLLANDRLGYGDARLHGAGRMMIELTRALLRRGVRVTPVILRGAGRLGEETRRAGLPFEFLARRPYDPRTLGDFLRLIRERRIQVLHLQAFGASTFGRLAAWRSGVPAIVHVHADHRAEPKGYPWFVRLADALLAPRTAHVLAVSETVSRFVVEHQGFQGRSVQVLHNPIDLERFFPPAESVRAEQRRALGLGPGTTALVCVARFHPVKGVDVLVEAWATVAREHPEAVLLLLGDGPQRGALEQAAQRIPGGDRIRFLGYRTDVERVLGASDLFVLPSRNEGLPFAALEAMATGLAAVASRVGGVPELIREGESGLLVPPGDPPALARGLGTLLADAALRARLGRGGRAVAEAHSLERFAETLEGLYRSLVGAASAPLAARTMRTT